MNKGYLSAFVAAMMAAILMGSLCVFVRESACSAPACSLGRFGIGLLLIGLYGAVAVVRGKGSLKFSGKAFISGIGISLCILFYFLAIQETSAGIAALLPATGPLFAAVWEALLEHHLPPKRDALLILTAGLGIVLVSVLSGSGSGGQNDALGILYGLLSGLFYSLYIVLNRFMTADVSILQRTFWQSAAGTMVLLIPLSFTAGALNNLSSGWPWLLGIGLCQGVGVLVLVAFAMRKLSSLEFGIVSCLEPLEAALIGFFVYSEVIMAGQWCGFALVLSAILAKSVLTRSTSVEPAAKPALDDDYEEEYNESLT
ncbi:MAG: EamA family transporter [Akkermansia sp.]|nr:EamA family transporter [Akkermansia sp.]